MALNERIVRQAKPKEKKYALSDGRGLLLEVRPAGQKYWVVRAWKDGREKRRHIGKYPEMSLKGARARAVEARSRVFDGSVEAPRKAVFGDVAEEWLEKRMGEKSPSYLLTIRLRMEKYILPALRDVPIEEVTSGSILRLCREIEGQGLVETARRVRAVIGQVFRYAMATDRAGNDPTLALAGALQTRKPRHIATLTNPEDIAALMRSINAYPRAMLRHALRFSVLVFCRPGEVRRAEWAEVDFEASEWRIPAEKMKMGRAHIVPLATQTAALLRALRGITGGQRWLFPSARGDGRPMSENAVRVALRSMGYANEDITPHGFRSMASTRLNEMGWTADVIERQLAHAERNPVRAAYNHAEYLEERRKMMQAWADYLEGLAASSMEG